MKPKYLNIRAPHDPAFKFSTNEDSAAVKSNTFFLQIAIDSGISLWSFVWEYMCNCGARDSFQVSVRWKRYKLIKMALVFSYFNHKDVFKTGEEEASMIAVCI
jgi:hypothetical protein